MHEIRKWLFVMSTINLKISLAQARTGFFMLELALSLAMAGILAACACSWYVHCLMREHQAYGELEALALGASVLDRIMADPSQVSANSLPKKQGYDIGIDRIPLGTLSGYMQVTVTVSWTDQYAHECSLKLLTGILL